MGGGVFAALRDGYLDEFEMLMCKDAGGQLVLETWTLGVEWKRRPALDVLYPSLAGAVDAYEGSTSGAASPRDVSESTKDMLRSIGEEVAEMPPPPSGFLSLRILYVDGTPNDYEPTS